jgi:GntR family transcriptional regulator/MocR family aminotransferase
MDTEELAARLRAHGVLIEPGRPFFDPAREDRQHYRLGYGSIPHTRIAEGIAKIAATLGDPSGLMPSGLTPVSSLDLSARKP